MLAALVLLRPGVMPGSMDPYLHALAILLLVLGIVVGWCYSRSRIVFALVLLCLAEATLRWLGNGETLPGDRGRAVVGGLSVLLPLNLAAYSVLFLVIRCVLRRDPVDAGFVWS
jgi:hypothetical protein